tara:strand:- start:449 stop:724 length:276 start_codon:yes stop_codon:yes gene_type:complete
MEKKNNRKIRIEKKLVNLFNPIYLEVRDDSKKHKGHSHIANDAEETHFYINMISKAFNKMNKIDMHKLVYESLKDEFEGGLHALELNLYSE